MVELRDVRKDYRGLRPLRVERLELRCGESLALLGFDKTTAEVLVDLITGATLPDTGEVKVFGRPTTTIADPDEWLRSLDRVGMLTERSVLLEQLSAEQNLAIPFSLELENLSSEVRSQIAQLASEIGIDVAAQPEPVVKLPALARLRVRFGRALALNPSVLLSEHPSASLSRDEISAFAADFSRIVSRRGLASLVLTADRSFAALITKRVLTLQPATGELRSPRRRLFS